MKKKAIAYWVTTVLVSLTFLMSGFAKLTGDETLAAEMARMGFPTYMNAILGVWYLGAAVVIAAPGLKRAKEWAYAGAFFAMSGAFLSHAAMGDPLGELIPIFFITSFVVGSYVLRPETRRLAA